MAVSGAARGKDKKWSGDELKAAVRKFCLAEFRKLIGKPWTANWERILRYDAAHPKMRSAACENEARQVYKKLHHAMQQADAFAKSLGPKLEPSTLEVSHKVGGRVANYLAWWVPRFVSPLLEHASMDSTPKDFGENLTNPRAILAKTLDDYNMFDMPEAVGGGSSFLDARELAIVSLLVGNWPAKKVRSATVAEILDLETAAMRHHMRVHGARDHAPEQGIAAKRGPNHRRPAKHEK